MGGEDGLHLAQLDAEAAQLHLGVEATEVLEGAVREPTDLVAGAVEALAGKGSEGIGKEALGGEVGAVEVAASQTDAADEELTRDAEGQRVQVRVEDKGAHVVEGAADGDALGEDVGVDGGADGGLGGAVSVDEAATGLEARDELGRAGFTGDDERLNATQALGLELSEDGGGELEGGDGVLLQHLEEGRAREELVAGSEDEAGTGEEGGEDFGDGGVEGGGEELEEARAGPQVHEVGGLEGGVAQAALVQKGALGAAGGARGVDDVGEVVAERGEGEVVLGLALDARPVVIQEEDEAASVEQVLEGGVGEEDGGPGIRGDEVEALGGQRGVEGEPGATSLEGGEDGDDEVRGALEADGDEDIGADAEATQVVGELIGAGVELGVGEGLGAEAQSGSVGRAANLGLEEAVDEGRGGQLALGLVPVHQQLAAARSR